MSKSLIVHKQIYQVFVKGLENPLEVSWENGEKLRMVWGHSDCPPALSINGGSYGKFQIEMIVPFVEKISPERQEALAEHARIQALINQN